MKLTQDKFKKSQDYYLYRDEDANYIEAKNIQIAEELINFWSFRWLSEFRFEDKDLIVISKKIYKTKEDWMLCIEFEDVYIEITNLDKLNEVFK